MHRRYVVAGLAILSLAALGARAGDGWIDKDWKQWSKDDVKVVLHDSPWCKRWAKGQVTTSAALPGVSGSGKEGAAGEGAPVINYYLQIRSAMPVREAVIRETQLDRNYDSMSDSEKKTFDDQAVQFLNRTYGDVIVVHVLYSSNVQAFERQLAQHWQSIRPNAIPEEIYLINERGDRIPPVRFVSPKTGAYEFDMTFPRMVNGEPIIHEGDKTFSIQFQNPAVGTQAVRETSSGTGSAPAGGAVERKQGNISAARSPLPPTGASKNPTSPAVANFKAERVLVEFSVENMKWQGKVTY